MDYTKHKSTILAIIGVAFIGYLYTKYNEKKYKDDNIENYKIIQNSLINSNTSSMGTILFSYLSIT